MSVKFPEVTVKLIGEDGNAFFVLGKVLRALKRAGVSQEEINKFRDEATSGDYHKLLATCMEYVIVE